MLVVEKFAMRASILAGISRHPASDGHGFGDHPFAIAIALLALEARIASVTALVMLSPVRRASSAANWCASGLLIFRPMAAWLLGRH
jgi:hypothetical protein